MRCLAHSDSASVKNGSVVCDDDVGECVDEGDGCLVELLECQALQGDGSPWPGV